jgi:hypothetical protein
MLVRSSPLPTGAQTCLCRYIGEVLLHNGEVNVFGVTVKDARLLR